MHCNSKLEPEGYLYFTASVWLMDPTVGPVSWPWPQQEQLLTKREWYRKCLDLLKLTWPWPRETLGGALENWLCGPNPGYYLMFCG